jgi:hypothetical protein
MNPWLVAESKWAREKALECRNRAENLADPKWVKRRLKQIARDEADVLAVVRQWMRLVSERSMLRDNEERASEITRAERDAEHWEQIAAEQSARLEHNESYQGALVPDPSG